MQVKVIRAFRDKHTEAAYKAGDVIEVTKERMDEILEVGRFVEVVSKPKAKEKEPGDKE